MTRLPLTTYGQMAPIKSVLVTDSILSRLVVALPRDRPSIARTDRGYYRTRYGHSPWANAPATSGVFSLLPEVDPYLSRLPANCGTRREYRVRTVRCFPSSLGGLAFGPPRVYNHSLRPSCCTPYPEYVNTCLKHSKTSGLDICKYWSWIRTWLHLDAKATYYGQVLYRKCPHK